MSDPQPSGSTPDASYYNPADLKKFGQIGRVNKALADQYFAWYGSAMKDGALTAREKSLIALAVAHALKCPYCIDAYSTDCLAKGADEAQMSEAVHVAAAIAAGITLVHSVQMQNHIDKVQF
jgi:alkylhydroperoxidase/carboxymuconolactone decarboxylase family protein